MPGKETERLGSRGNSEYPFAYAPEGEEGNGLDVHLVKAGPASGSIIRCLTSHL